MSDRLINSKIFLLWFNILLGTNNIQSIFLKYSNSAANTIDEIKSEVLELNNIVTEFSLKQIYINYDNWKKHIDDLEKLPDPIDLPKTSRKDSKTFNIDRTTDFA